MGYNDAVLRFSNAQQVTTGSDSGVASTNVIDFNEARDMGVGRPLFIVIVITTAMTDASSNSALGTVLQGDNDEAFGSVDTTQDLGSFAAVSAVGSRLTPLIAPGFANRRYGRLLYTSTNGALSTGNFSAFITLDIDAWTAYPVGYDVIGP